jgi:hypothetical protein
MILPLLVFPAFAFIAWMPTMRGNHLPVSAARWQHGSQICFETFNWQKITKLLNYQQPLKHIFGILRIFDIFDTCFTKFKKQSNFT